MSLLFIFLSFSYTITALAHEDEGENTIVIHIDEKGFTPQNVEIESGTKVIFENTGQQPHWIATDNHPSHTLYDGTTLNEHCVTEVRTAFDSCEGIAPGESWSFVFEKEKVYGYHDHLWPHLSGEIMVSDLESENIQKKVSPKKQSLISRFIHFFWKIFSWMFNTFTDFKQEPVLQSGKIDRLWYEQLVSRYKNIVIDSNPRLAIQTLRTESQQDEKTLSLCHDVLHKIGYTTFKKYESFQKSVEYQNDFCNSGFIHGVFEAYFELVDDPLSGLTKQCTDFAKNKRAFNLWQCHHGIGHGLMYLTGGDLDASLTLCDENLEKNSAKSCQNGVYMEVFNSEVLAKKESYVNPKNPFLTCTKGVKENMDCYQYVPSYISQTLQKNYEEIFQDCKLLTSNYELACIQGIGSEALKRNMHNIESVFTMCSKAETKTKANACLSGAISIYMNQKGSYEAGKTLCDTISKKYKLICNKTVEQKKLFFEK